MKTLLKAAHFAATAHRSQRRKSKGDIPYINHPIGVADYLASVGVEDEEVLAAALLHDTVEDCDISHKDLCAVFGERIAGIVAEVTDDKSLPKAERKRLQIEHGAHLSEGAKLVKMADKLYNIRSIAKTPPVGWNKDRVVQYLDWSEKVVANLRGVHPTLEKMFDQCMIESRQEVDKLSPVE